MPEAELDMARRCWAWIDSKRKMFAMPAEPCDPLRIRQLKPLSELALAAEIGLASGLALKPSAHDVAGFCWADLEEGELLLDLLGRYPDLFAAIGTYATLARFGFRHRALEEQARRMVRRRGIRALEFPPWRELDVAVSLLALGLSWPRRLDTIYRRTWLAAEPEPWMICESSAYSLTHTVFYMTEFGREPAGLPRVTRNYLEQWVPAWCDLYATIGNFDLLAEMIMVARCIELPEHEYQFAITSLHSAIRCDGSVPGPVEPPPADRLTGRQYELACFWADYHTTLVSFLAGAMVARPMARRSRTNYAL